MGLTVQHMDNLLVCISHDELGRETRSDLSPLLVLGDDLHRFLKPILDDMRLKRPATIRGEIGRLKSVGEALSHLHITQLPQTEPGWQSLVSGIHRFILTRTDRKSSLRSRCSSEWVKVRGFLISLVEAGILPISTYIPPVRDTLASVNIAPYQDRLLGQAPAQSVNDDAPVDKLLCSISLARTDAEYLEELRDSLSSRRHLLKEVLTKHWRYIKANIEFGKKLLATVDWNELEPLIESHPKGFPKNHPAYPLRDLSGLANYLAVIRHKYDGCPWSDDDFRKLTSTCEYIPRQATFGSIENLARKFDAPEAPYKCGGWSDRNALWWWQGRISHLDVSAISALLIMLHPSWTPVALLFARVADRNGKQYLDFGDGGFSYEVTKHRAKAMKQETLDPLAYEIISTLIHEFAPLRRDLLKANDSRSSLLFLPYGKNKVASPIPSAAVGYISGKVAQAKAEKLVWLGSIYPELADGGLTAGMITFKKIRNTEGVLEWFRTKSLRAVSRKLGNTEKVVLQHYIPKALLDAWNTRMIRRFQNLWLSVAAANEEFLLDVTDFGSLADLHAFLRDMLQMHSATDSPLAELLHRKFGIQSNNEQSTAFSGDAHLHVAISKGALSALYTYHATVIDLGISGDVLDTADVITGLSPRHFMSLADLLQSRLPEDKNPEYVACHEAAMQFAYNPENRSKWAELIP